MIVQKAIKIEKVKESKEVQEQLVEEVFSILEEDGPRVALYIKTRVKGKIDLALSTVNSMKVAESKSLWKDVKNHLTPVEMKWTKDNESKLQMMKNGDIESASDTSSFRASFSRKCNFLCCQVPF